MHGCRGRRLCIRDDNGRAFHCDAKKELRKFKRKPDTSMGVGIAWQIASVQCDPAPGHALHVRHLCPLIDTRSMMNLFFQDRENTCGSRVTWTPRAHAGSRDTYT